MENSKDKIFNEICGIVTNEDFTNGQMDFFTQNCTEFNDDEENKHSYMDTYEKYVKLIDETIDAQL